MSVKIKLRREVKSIKKKKIDKQTTEKVNKISMSRKTEGESTNYY